jgi:DNA-binding transcriptional MerR regulator
MRYSVEELAARAAVSVDTIRYYQTRGLLHPPGRHGRRAVYDESHVERLAWIRDLTDRGWSLKSIEEMSSRDREGADARLEAALREGRSDAVYTREEFAKVLGLPLPLLAAVEKTGLAAPQPTERGAGRYTEADLAAARGALRLLERGFPLTELLGLAVSHHKAVTGTVDRAIDLFDDYVRKRADGRDAERPEAVAEAYRELLPVVTGLVAHHFQRVLANRALERLETSGEKRTWRTAIKETARARLKLSWR